MTSLTSLKIGVWIVHPLGAGGQQMPTPRTRHPVSVSPQKMAWKSWKQSIAAKSIGVLWIKFFWFWKKIGHLDFGTRLHLGPSLVCFFSTRKVMPEKSRLLCSIGFFLRWKSWSLKWSERRSKNIARRSSLSRIAWFERWRSWRSPSLTLPSVSTWPCSKRCRFLFSPQKYPLPTTTKKGTFCWVHDFPNSPAVWSPLLCLRVTLPPAEVDGVAWRGWRWCGCGDAPSWGASWRWRNSCWHVRVLAP